MINDRLRGGIKADEAIARAAQWWDRHGRRLVAGRKLSAFNTIELGRRVSFSSAGPMLINKGEHVPYVPSGILNGYPWAQLTRSEQLSVVKQWHEVWLKDQQHTRLADPSKNESQRAIDLGFTDEQIARAKKAVAEAVKGKLH